MSARPYLPGALMEDAQQLQPGQDIVRAIQIRIQIAPSKARVPKTWTSGGPEVAGRSFD